LFCKFSFLHFHGNYFLLLNKQKWNLAMSSLMDVFEMSGINETCYFCTFVLISKWKHVIWYSFICCWHSALKIIKLKKPNFRWISVEYSNFFILSISLCKTKLFAFNHLCLAKISKAHFYIWLNQNWSLLSDSLLYSFHTSMSHCISSTLV